MNYRAEIDGLRAIAVTSVILYHAGIAVVPGGFAGVDIFFVISGFLITTLILKDQANGSFSLFTFYERRARRILPALFVVLLATIVVGYSWMTYWDYSDFLRSAAAAALFLSNVHFWEHTSYFALAAEEQPLLHTWSLAVEEQFYLLFPLLLMLRIRRRILVWTVGTMFFASLALAQWGAVNEPEVNFFFTPSRVWELLAGALCAFWQFSRRPKPRGLLAATGLAMIAFSLLVYTTSVPFPSVYTLVPVVGTSLVLLFAHPGTRAQVILSRAPLIGLGLISYSAYLWHQPLFVFARMWAGVPLTAVQIMMLIIMIFALAYITWRWVEQPLRKGVYFWVRARHHVFALTLAGMSGFVMLFFTLDNRGHYLANLSPQQLQYLPYLQYEAKLRDGERRLSNNCTLQIDEDFELCLQLSTDRPNVLLIGDSHASHFADALKKTYPEVNLVQSTTSGCRPLLDYSGKTRCTDLARFLLEDFIPEGRIDVVILSGRWRYRDVAAVSRTVQYLKAFVPRVVVFGPTMEYTTDIPMLLVKHANAGREVISDRAMELRREDRPEVAYLMGEAVIAAGADYVDIQSFLCPQDDCLIFTPIGDLVTYDYGHFLPDAANWVIGEVRATGALEL